MLLKQKVFNCYTDYAQFVLRDKENEALPSENQWSQSENPYIVESNGIFYIATRHSLETEFKVEIHDQKPDSDPDAAQIIEFSIAVPSGEIVVEEIIKSPRLNVISVEPGSYRVRLNLHISSNAEDEGSDKYLIMCWKTDFTDQIEIIKKLIFK